MVSGTIAAGNGKRETGKAVKRRSGAAVKQAALA